MLLTSIALYASSESFYKKQYEFYIKKEKKALSKWRVLNTIVSMDENTIRENEEIDSKINNMVIASGGNYDPTNDPEKDAKDELEKDREKAEIAHKEYVNYLDKITELSFKVEEDLHKLPKWFVVPKEESE